MYPNLDAEMARIRIKPKDLLEVLKTLGESEKTTNIKTVRSKLNKKGFTIKEAIAIRNKYFSNMVIDYLFATEEEIEKIKKIS